MYQKDSSHNCKRRGINVIVHQQLLNSFPILISHLPIPLESIIKTKHTNAFQSSILLTIQQENGLRNELNPNIGILLFLCIHCPSFSPLIYLPQIVR